MDNIFSMPVKGQGNIGKMQNNKVNDKGLVEKVMDFNIKVMDLAKNGKPKSVQEMESRFYDYFQLCKTVGFTPTVEGLSLCTDYSRTSIFEIENRRICSTVCGHHKKGEAFYTEL